MREAVLDFLLAREEDVKSYWRLLARVWKKFSFSFAVADMLRSVDSALSGINAKSSSASTTRRNAWTVGGRRSTFSS
ncbi:hypothetical protein L3N51_02334 [Metallosphaera sp. J1]|uniref:hypothetical protein n=1 Tax=Metallosphaera javensis (ex Hofmann et al. 2022) TaxID=99938 RepID=UPI001EDD75BF|nr:hypothetical protein [Metallosphaera javensis (ex Hofmann et al. 2022)]MCG3110037.1 hypothetical protein [Metallosphaera javensis (ex Hofmann et al. 2022)]